MSGAALVVDDDAVSRLVMSHLLSRRGWTVDEVGDTPAALLSLAERAYDVVVSDFDLPSGTGLDVLAAAEGTQDPPAFVLVTGLIGCPTPPDDLRTKLVARLSKPVSTQALDAALAVVFPPVS